MRDNIDEQIFTNFFPFIDPIFQDDFLLLVDKKRTSLHGCSDQTVNGFKGHSTRVNRARVMQRMGSAKRQVKACTNKKIRI